MRLTVPFSTISHLSECIRRTPERVAAAAAASQNGSKRDFQLQRASVLCISYLRARARFTGSVLGAPVSLTPARRVDGVWILNFAWWWRARVKDLLLALGTSFVRPSWEARDMAKHTRETAIRAMEEGLRANVNVRVPPRVATSNEPCGSAPDAVRAL